MGAIPLIPRHLLVIEKPGEGNEYDGFPEDNWERVREIWGDVKPVHDSTDDRERNRAGRMEPHITHRVFTMYFAGYSSSYRMLMGDRIFNVESVINLGERNRMLEWQCVENV